MRNLSISLVFILLTVGSAARGDVRVTTPDGREVLLKDDKTWEYVDSDVEGDEARAVLSVTRHEDFPNACEYGLTLFNGLDYTIQSVVPQFSAYTRDGVLFHTVFMEFRGLRPKRSQYRQIRFSGIRCENIRSIKVHGGDRCNMGELNKWSPERGECLRRIKVESGTVVSISK